MSRNHMTYQPTQSQIGVSSFFKEAIDASPVPREVDVGSIYIALPTQPAEFNNLGGSETPQNILQSVQGDKKLNRRAHTRRQSQTNETLFESSASGKAAEPPMPRKRGRKPKKQSKEQKVAGQREKPDDDGLPKDPRRRRVLERNRMAANKCRLRKRDKALALASQEEAMEDRNRYLMTCFDSLTVEIYYLKTQLLQHTDCNCVLIQKYIANEAKKCADGMLASSAFDTHGSSWSPDHRRPSDANTAGELSMRGLEAGSSPPIWTNFFQQEPGVSKISDDIFAMGLEPIQKATMPSDSIVSTQPVQTFSLTKCELGLYLNVGPQEHQADEVAWGSYWQV
ncbi:hypothetical protein FOMA001_g18188 [Fusarium oxysporum f. sp. matthiolae]|nr:hypothetical protein FOMA001_g18188 [Fusarium oxysporum f. sp. matthiolae]